MILDVFTIVMIAAVLALIIGVSLQVALREYPASFQPSIRSWVRGTLLLPVGWVLYGMRDVIPDFISIVVANAVLGLAFARHVEAIRRFTGRPDNTALILGPVLAIVLCECVFTYAVPSFRMRGVTVSAIVSAQLWCAVFALWQHGERRRRSHLLSAAAFAILAFALLLRWVLEVIDPNGLSAALASSPMQTVVFGLLAAFPVAATLGFLLMCNDRLFRSLEQNQQRLRAITDNLPTIVAHIDTSERFTFANAHLGRLLDMDPRTIIGRSMLEVLGPNIHDEVKPHIDTVLHGQAVTFQMEREYAGRHRYYEASYVPDVDANGVAQGFYVLIVDISRLKRDKQELARMAQQDSLTGLANRNKFGEMLAFGIARANRVGRALGLLYIDIDYFKKINDCHGHAVGDAVLREFAARLVNSLRETDLAARLGGDEFVVLIEDVESQDALEKIARKLLDAFRPEFVVDTLKLTVSASIGIGIAHADADGETVLGRADKALYAAKAAGRGTYRITTAVEPSLAEAGALATRIEDASTPPAQAALSPLPHARMGERVG